MGKEEKKEQMSKVYREFSRQKYNKYKHQFPKMRESQIVSKIIKEWDLLDNVAKDNLHKIYEQKKFLTNQDISSSEALMKAEQAKRDALKAAQRSLQQSTPVRQAASTFLPKSGVPSDSDYRKSSEQHGDSKVIDSESPGLVVRAPKTKGIAKQTKSDYIVFYKSSYVRISKEHPNWQPNQITNIIKLLWKKRKNQNKAILNRQIKEGKQRQLKVISGRRFFRKFNHLTYSESKVIWNRLPLETKNFWGNKAKRTIVKSTINKETKVTLKSHSADSENNSAGWGYLKKKSTR